MRVRSKPMLSTLVGCAALFGATVAMADDATPMKSDTMSSDKMSSGKMSKTGSMMKKDKMKSGMMKKGSMPDTPKQ